MTIRRLPPVRTAVPLQRWTCERAAARVQNAFPGHRIWLCRSGTDALAASIEFAKACRPVARPEVILPAYGCPDLVAACIAAKVQPRLVDIADSSWAYDIAALTNTLSESTVGVLAVNLLGLGDDVSRLSKLLTATGVTLIRDSAQHVPVDADEQEETLPTVLSFGRGKPVNSLAGGALLMPDSASSGLSWDASQVITSATEIERKRDALIGSRLMSATFNVATTPKCYGMISRIPGLELGETRYVPLDRIAGMHEQAWRRIGPAFDAYVNSRSNLGIWTSRLPDLSELGIVMPGATTKSPSLRMLRFPLLARDRSMRDSIVKMLMQRGLGASAFYDVALNTVSSIPMEVRAQGPFQNAANFAERLFTLPTHSNVDESVVSETLETIRLVLRGH